MTLYYEIRFFDYWHLSSGLSAGAKLDSMVIKDKNNLPYAPAKTIKGLAREMAELLNDSDFVNTCFGGSTDTKDSNYDATAKNMQGVCYFANATLSHQSKEQILSHKLQENLYEVIASTKIGENSIAIDGSLREIEVVIPITLYGEIKDIPDVESMQKMTTVLSMIKRMGLNRNRGLGRCELRVSKEQK